MRGRMKLITATVLAVGASVDPLASIVVLDMTTRRAHLMRKTQQPSIGLGRGHTPS
jgi:hypothetical protein